MDRWIDRQIEESQLWCFDTKMDFYLFIFCNVQHRKTQKKFTVYKGSDHVL